MLRRVRCADAVSLDHVSTNELPRRSVPQLAARRHRHADHVRYDHGLSRNTARRQYTSWVVCAVRAFSMTCQLVLKKQCSCSAPRRTATIYLSK